MHTVAEYTGCQTDENRNAVRPITKTTANSLAAVNNFFIFPNLLMVKLMLNLVA